MRKRIVLLCVFLSMLSFLCLGMALGEDTTSVYRIVQGGENGEPTLCMAAAITEYGDLLTVDCFATLDQL